jgi:hypothetical protein
MQAALIPIAYTVGTDFRPAARHPLDTMVHWERWWAGWERGPQMTRPALWALLSAMWQGICHLATGACASGTPVAAVGPAVKCQGVGRSLPDPSSPGSLKGWPSIEVRFVLVRSVRCGSQEPVQHHAVVVTGDTAASQPSCDHAAKRTGGADAPHGQHGCDGRQHDSTSPLAVPGRQMVVD